MTWRFWERKKKVLSAQQLTSRLFEEPLAPSSCSAEISTLPSLPVVCRNKKELCCTEPIRLSVCEKCGACCAFFPVTFPEIEKDDLTNGATLSAMSLPSRLLVRVMRGTEVSSPRCMALEGEIGKCVRCAIYAGRPSTCRDFKRSWEDDTGNSLCDKARAVYGLQPFSQY